MQNSNDENKEYVAPYRAAENLNTSIGNPTMDVNDPMNMNITSVATNPVSNTNNDVNNNSVGVNQQPLDVQNNQVSPSDVQIPTTNTIDNNNNNVKRVFVSNNNTPKKKITINIGTEFKIAFLIIVILLAFILILPMISSLFS